MSSIPAAATRMPASAPAPRPAAPAIVYPPRQAFSLENSLLALFLSGIIATVFIVIGPGCRHWLILPVMVCGVVSGTYVIAWLRGHIDTFDPVALIGLILYHGTFIAPLIHMGMDQFVPEWNSALGGDWAPWFGRMAFFNALGLVAFALAERWMFKRTKPARTEWRLDRQRFITAMSVVLGISLIASAVVLFRFGGLGKESDERAMMAAEGVGSVSWILMLSDPVALLFASLLIVLMSSRSRRGAFVLSGVLLAAVLVAQFVFAGARGSRSVVVFVLFMATVLTHFRIRRVPVAACLVAGVFLFIGLYYYGFYKRLGSRGLKALQSAAQHEALSERYNISMLGTALGDLSRADLQAYCLYRLNVHGDRYRLRKGKTYVASALMLIPRALWRDKPYGKLHAGTDLLYGEGTYDAGVVKTSKVFGIAGEMMLNFGSLPIPLAFAVLGVVVGGFRRKYLTMDPLDARLIFAPLVILLLLLAPNSDSDNLMFTGLKFGVLLIAAVWYASNRVARRPAMPGGPRGTAPPRRAPNVPRSPIPRAVPGGRHGLPPAQPTR